jgi:hypothetical protein
MTDTIQPDTLRQEAQREAEEDLFKKSIVQLVTDVHHETKQPRSIEENILHADKRMVSMMGKVALESEKASKRLERLTIVLVVLTLALVVLTTILAYVEFVKPP